MSNEIKPVWEVMEIDPEAVCKDIEEQLMHESASKSITTEQARQAMANAAGAAMCARAFRALKSRGKER